MVRIPRLCPVLAVFLLLASLTTPLPGHASELTRAVTAGDSASVARLLATEQAADLLDETDDHGFLPVHLAVQHGQRALLATLVNAGADLNAADRHGRRPLHLAAALGDSTVTGWLLEHGADLEATDDAGQSALHHAAATGHTAALSTLLAWQPPVNTRDKAGRTALHAAVLAGQLETARVLLDHGAGPNLRAGDGFAALHHAALAGDVEMIRVLLKAYADMHLLADNSAAIPDLRGGTALHAAVWAEQPTATVALLEDGADSQRTTAGGDTPLMLAIRLHADELTTRLLSAGAAVTNPGGDASPLSLALDRRDTALLNRLFDYGASPDSLLPSADTPLLAATRRQHPELVELLLRRGASPDLSVDRERPLRVAVAEGQAGLARVLLDGDADPNRPDTLSSLLGLRGPTVLTPLAQAVDQGDLALTRALLEYGAAVDLAPDADQPSLVGRAIKTRALPVLRLLVAQGAAVHPEHPMDDLAAALDAGYIYLRELLPAAGINPLAVDDDERTALHLAVRQNDDPRTISALLAAGVPVDALNNDGRSALHLAARRGHARQVRALLDAGADPTLTDRDGKTPLDMAKGAAEGVLLTR